MQSQSRNILQGKAGQQLSEPVIIELNLIIQPISLNSSQKTLLLLAWYYQNLLHMQLHDLLLLFSDIY
jgi:hypothetical protein